MRDMNRAAVAGAILLALSLIGYVIYQAVLYPAAGFPTEDFGVVEDVAIDKRCFALRADSGRYR